MSIWRVILDVINTQILEFGINRLPSVTWVGPTQSVEGLNRTKRWVSLSKREFSAELDFVCTIISPGSLSAGLQVRPALLTLLGLETASLYCRFVLVGLHNPVSQCLIIYIICKKERDRERHDPSIPRLEPDYRGRTPAMKRRLGLLEERPSILPKIYADNLSPSFSKRDLQHLTRITVHWGKGNHQTFWELLDTGSESISIQEI